MEEGDDLAAAPHNKIVMEDLETAEIRSVK
jgi:hypothetical protein